MKDDDFVDIKSCIPDIFTDVLYAKAENCFNRKLYPIAKIFLRRGCANKLFRVQESLRGKGLSLLITDGYRPFSIQKKIFSLTSDPNYVADPAIGSKHNRGAAVDVTLVDFKGCPLPMGSEIDDLSPRAHRDYPDLMHTERLNRQRLEELMMAQGFLPLPTEWWHYDDADWEEYPVSDQCLTTL